MPFAPRAKLEALSSAVAPKTKRTAKRRKVEKVEEDNGNDSGMRSLTQEAQCLAPMLFDLFEQ